MPSQNLIRTFQQILAQSFITVSNTLKNPKCSLLHRFWLLKSIILSKFYPITEFYNDFLLSPYKPGVILLDIGKQYKPRLDVASDQDHHCWLTECSIKI